MNTLSIIVDFLIEHQSKIYFAAYVVIRDWKTVGGRIGLINFWNTGKITPPETAQPQTKV